MSVYAPRTGVVLDPFVGSGTSLVEAARLGIAACGGELNPAAIILARVYRLINLNGSVRASVLDGLQEQVFDLVGPSHGSLFSSEAGGWMDRAALETALVRLWRESAPGATKILVEALIVLCDFHRKDLNADTILKNWLRISRTVRCLPESALPIDVYHADARALPIESDSIDFVLTSPPYINVHNYHQKFRRSVEALQWDVLALARSEIGSNRQNRGNRFLTVIQYSLDMALALREMARTARPGTRLILVIGRESLVRRTRFYNGELVAELAVRSVRLEIERRQERKFRNRYGTDIYEDILHFRSTSDLPDESCCLMMARCIAEEVLSANRALVSDEARSGIDDAIARIDSVLPSPMPTPESLAHTLA